MLSVVFLKVLDMSRAACVVILAVMAVRIPLKLFPKLLSYALWAVVLARLLCPVSISAPVGLVPGPDPALRELAAQTRTGFASRDPEPVEAPAPAAGTTPPGTASPENEAGTGRSASAGWRGALLTAGQYLWLAGALGLPVYDLIRCLWLKRSLRGAERLRGNIYVSERVASPFTLGLLRPRIYLPAGLQGRDLEFVILHEKRHIRRLDHIFKALAFLALSVHWFNPLVWLAFAMASADMEMSCDEAVVRALGEDARADYCASLLAVAADGKIPPRLTKTTGRS